MGCKIAKLTTLGFFLAPTFVSAQVVISEIMYDLAEGGDTGREWVEVHNAGSESVNLTEWKFFESDTNHGLKAISGEILAPGAYAIIADNPAKFATDWPSFSGLVFDSAFALNNSGETLVLRCCGKEPTDRDSVTYNNTGGGAGDGFSLHRSGSSIVAAKPSPGSGAVEAPAPKPKEPEPTPELPPQSVEQPKIEPVVQEAQNEPQTTVATSRVQEKETTQEISAPVAVPATVVVQEESEVPPPGKKSIKKVTKVETEEFEDAPLEEVITQEAAPVAIAQVAAAHSSSPPSDWLWWLCAAAVSFFGAGGAYMAGRGQRKREWKIEEVD